MHSKPMVTWGINPGQVVAIDDTLPEIGILPEVERETAKRAYEYMEFSPVSPLRGKKSMWFSLAHAPMDVFPICGRRPES